MTGRTHDLAAFTALTLTFIWLPVLPPMSLATAVVAFGANFVGGLFPDIDQPTSDFWDNFRLGPFIAKIICPAFGGHRHISHSLVGVVFIGSLSYLILGALAPLILINMNIVWASFMIGMISHLISDLPTKEGLPLFWPVRWKIGIPPFRWMRIEAGEWVENFIIFPGLLLFNAYLLISNKEKVLLFLKLFLK